MSFSPQWLALREPVDRDSRNADIAMEVAAHFAGAENVRVVDLGCGTGSNLRATALLLPARQEWLLVDHDAGLLDAARLALTDWADTAQIAGDRLVLTIAERHISVRLAQADLSDGVTALVAAKPDLVTASALFDLISSAWIGRFAADLAATGAAFYTVLTYNGEDRFAPPHALDADVIAAFGAHQGGDKGFGPAAGPNAPAALRAGLAGAGYEVAEGDSPWRIGIQQKNLARDLLTGIARAVAETGRIEPQGLADWLSFRLDAAQTAAGRMVTGHTDTFATRP